VKNHRDWILSSGSHTGVLAGGFLEVIVALACIGTAVGIRGRLHGCPWFSA
jgi:hypothetical protein